MTNGSEISDKEKTFGRYGENGLCGKNSGNCAWIYIEREQCRRIRRRREKKKSASVTGF